MFTTPQALQAVFDASVSPSAEFSLEARLDAWQLPFIVHTTVGFFIATYAIRTFLLNPIALRLLNNDAKRADKFAQSASEFIQYSAFFLLGARLLARQSWSWPSAGWWSGQSIGLHATGSLSVAAFYLLYFSRYVSNLVFVLLVDLRRKDFWEMVIHHAVTALLVGLSFVGIFWRVGLVIMVLLDIGDPPLHLAKMFKYMHEVHGNDAYIFVANRTFEVFGVAFFVTRIVMYGYVNWSCWSEGYSEAAKDGKPHGFASVITACNTMVSILYVLQWFWFGLLINAVIKMSSTGQVEDNRSDSESEGPAGKSSKNKKKRQ